MNHARLRLHGRLWCRVVIAAGVLLGGLVACGKTPEPSAPAGGDVPSVENITKDMPDFGGSERIATRAVGYGPSLPAAVDAAILSAIKQVNGQAVDASSVSSQHGLALSIGGDVAQISAAEFSQSVATMSRGAVTDFRLLSHSQEWDKSFVVEIEASVAKFRPPESASLPRLMVAPFRVAASSTIVGDSRLSPADLELSIRQDIVTALSRTNRFTVLDRDAAEAIRSELDLIGSGEVAQEDVARLGQALSADLVLVGRVEQFSYEKYQQPLRTSGRMLTHYEGGARLVYRLINLATRQIVATDTVQIELPQTKPTTLPGVVDSEGIAMDMRRELSDRVSLAILTKFFPITVAARQGDDLVLSQGEPLLVAGRRYRVYQLGGEIRDPQSGRSLGRTEQECCIIEISRTTPDIAYARVVEKSMEMPAEFVSGSLEVREEVVPPIARVEGSAKGLRASSPAASTKPAAAKEPASQAVKNSAAEDGDW